VDINDISIALDSALRDLPGNSAEIQEFSCITHSTGGPVVRYWLDKYYGSANLANAPLKHLVMLAPANRGSALGVLGKKKVGRIKAWFNGIEPGQRVLDWLSLGSEGQWELNQKYLSYSYAKAGVYPFVLIGQGIDKAFYDFLNSYLVESGSDGVVRVSGANMNYQFINLVQTDEVLYDKPLTTSLVPSIKSTSRRPNVSPLGVFSAYSHSGNKMGIMRSPGVSKKEQVHPVVREILKCLAVKSAADYKQRGKELQQLTETEQKRIPEGKSALISQYAMLVVNIHDQYGNKFGKDEFEVLLLAGKNYSPKLLPSGFLLDRQLNGSTNNLVYYVDAIKMQEINEKQDGLFGIQILARPTQGFSKYNIGEFRSDGLDIGKVFSPNETTYVDITMKRIVDKSTFKFRNSSQSHENFKDEKPSGSPAN